MVKRLLSIVFVLVCGAAMLTLTPPQPAHAAPGDLVNVALNANVNVKASKENAPAETAVKLFDNSSATKWLAGQTSNAWVQIQFLYGDTQAVKKYGMVSADDAPTRDPKNWRIEGSNDGMSWTVLDEQSNQTFSARFQTKEYVIQESKVNEYAYYRLFILNNNGESSNTQLADWKLYAVELDDASAVASAVASLDLGNTNGVKQGFALPSVYRKGTTVTWISSNPVVLSHTGKLIKRPQLGEPDVELTLTATVKKGAVSQTKLFNVKVSALTEADLQYEAGIDFDSGFETGEPLPTDTTGPANTYRLLHLTKNVDAFCCGIGGMESKRGDGAHNGAAALQYSGNATSAAQSYAYNQIFDTEIAVKASTTLSYWLFPEKETSVLPSLVRTTSRFVALDIQFTDGTYLHELNAKDQHGIVLHPNAQGRGGYVIEDQWNFITVNIGEVADGKIIDKILFGFDASGAGSGFFRGSVDDITIEHDSTTGEGDTRAVNADLAALSLGDTTAVTHDLNLPKTGQQQTTIAWESSNPNIMNDAGRIVSRPAHGEAGVELKLTATVSKRDSAAKKVFLVRVLPMGEAEAVELDAEWLLLAATDAIADDLTLPVKGKYGASIAWQSSNPGVISESGRVIRPGLGQPDAKVDLTATITSGAAAKTKSFALTVVALGATGDLSADREALRLSNAEPVTRSLFLPLAGTMGSTITWESSNEAIISKTGQVVRPSPGQPDATVTLTATLANGAERATKSFTVTVKALSADEESLAAAFKALELGNTSAVEKNLSLPIRLNDQPNVVITWASSDPLVVDFHGNINPPCYGDPNVTVVLRATLKSGNSSIVKTFNVTVKALGAVEEPAKDNADLSAIKIGGELLSEFNKTKVAYTTELPKGTTQAPTVEATAADPDAKVNITQAAGLPGSAVIKVTAEDGITVKTYTVSFTVQQAPGTSKASLTGTDKIVSGATLELTYGLSSVNQNGQAQDLTLTFDSEKLEFLSAASLQEGFIVVEKKETEGQVRIIAAKIGAEELLSGKGLLTLQWKAKPAVEPSSTTITLSPVVISDAGGVETELEGVTHALQIQIVNKASLLALINEAQAVHDAAVEGSGAGQYPTGSKAVLQAAINSAKSIAEETSAPQEKVEQAAAALSKALQTFRSSVHVYNPGDMNGDDRYSVGDLAIIASYYGKTSSDPNWHLYKKADLNNDGIIDIIDLALLARKILN